MHEDPVVGGQRHAVNRPVDGRQLLAQGQWLRLSGALHRRPRSIRLQRPGGGQQQEPADRQAAGRSVRIDGARTVREPDQAD